ncbi:hypothetical protein ACWEPL_22150 [Nonomuraea sp. NPDC004186]
MLGRANGLWLHVWRCAVRRDDFAGLARLASLWVASAPPHLPAQFVSTSPIQL